MKRRMADTGRALFTCLVKSPPLSEVFMFFCFTSRFSSSTWVCASRGEGIASERASQGSHYNFSASLEWFSIALSCIFGKLSCEEDFCFRNEKRGFKNPAERRCSSSFGLPPSMSVSVNEHWGQMNIFSLAFHSQTTEVILKALAVNHVLLLFKKPHKHYLLPAQEPCSISLQNSTPASAEPARRRVRPSGRKAVPVIFCGGWC